MISCQARWWFQIFVGDFHPERLGKMNLLLFNRKNDHLWGLEWSKALEFLSHLVPWLYDPRPDSSPLHRERSSHGLGFCPENLRNKKLSTIAIVGNCVFTVFGETCINCVVENPPFWGYLPGTTKFSHGEMLVYQRVIVLCQLSSSNQKWLSMGFYWDVLLVLSKWIITSM